MLRLEVRNAHLDCRLQVIAQHKLWAEEKDLCGRIYLSTQGINAQYSGLTADAEGYAKWLETQDLFKVCKLTLLKSLECTSQSRICTVQEPLSASSGQCALAAITIKKLLHSKH